MCNRIKGLFDVFSSLWLIVDMVFDIITTKDFYDAAKRVSGESYPFDNKFVYRDVRNSDYVNFSPGSGTKVAQDQLNFYPEAAFFYASASSMLLPIPIAIISVTIWTMIMMIRSLYHKQCGLLLCLLLGPFTLLPALLAGLVTPLAWVISPILHFIQALFCLFGVRPGDETNSRVKGPKFSKFWAFVLILKVIEQFFEAVPQVGINAVFFYMKTNNYLHAEAFTDQEYYTRVTSMGLSVGSVLLFISANVYNCAHDYDNSLLGLLRGADDTPAGEDPETPQKTSFVKYISQAATLQRQVSRAEESSRELDDLIGL